MQLKHLLQTSEVKIDSISGIPIEDCLGSKIKNLNDVEGVVSEDNCDIAIVGIPEGRNSVGNDKCSLAPSLIRNYLYGLRANNKSQQILDLGDILGNSLKDKYRAVEEVVAILSDLNIIVIIIGGSQEFTLPICKGFKSDEKQKRLTVVDSKADIIVDSEDFCSQNYIKSIVELNDTKINLVGLQRYLVGNLQEDYLNTADVNIVRLGELRKDDIRDAEPIFRDSEIVSFDVSSIAGSFMPAQYAPMPNGLSAFEACQISWFAGMSDRLKIVSLFELNSEKDATDNGILLGAQMIWHFIEGAVNRVQDYPIREIESYTVYHVSLEDLGIHIRFFCNVDNDRWWVELPHPSGKEVFSCSRRDYHMIKENQMPEKWWSNLIESSCKSEKK